MFDLNVVTFDSKEVPSGSHEFIRMMKTTLPEAGAAMFASDAAFFTTEQVTSVAEEMIGDAPVMCFQRIPTQTRDLFWTRVN